MKTKLIFLWTMFWTIIGLQGFCQQPLSKKYVLYGESITWRLKNSNMPAAFARSTFILDSVMHPGLVGFFNLNPSQKLPTLPGGIPEILIGDPKSAAFRLWHSFDTFPDIQQCIVMGGLNNLTDEAVLSLSGIYTHESVRYFDLSKDKLNEFPPLGSNSSSMEMCYLASCCRMRVSVCPNHKARIKPLGLKNSFRASDTVVLEAESNRINEYQDADFVWEYSLDGLNFKDRKSNNYNWPQQSVPQFSGKTIRIALSDIAEAEVGKPIFFRLKSCFGFHFPDGKADSSYTEIITFFPELPDFSDGLFSMPVRCPNEAPQPLFVPFKRPLEAHETVTGAYVYQTVNAEGKPLDAQELDFSVNQQGITITSTKILNDGVYLLQMRGTALGFNASSRSTQIRVNNPPVLEFEKSVFPASGTDYHQGVPKLVNDGKFQFLIKNYTQDHSFTHYKATLSGEHLHFQNPSICSPLDSGLYWTTIHYNNHQCDTTFSTHVELLPDGLRVSLDEASPISCYGQSDGSLIADIHQVTKISGTYFLYKNNAATYLETGSFQSLDTALIFNNLSSGNYMIACQAGVLKSTYTFTIKEPKSLEMSVNSVIHPSCHQAGDGSIQVIAKGGTPPYRYFWNNQEENSTLNNLHSGIYNLVIIDRHHCSLTHTFRLEDPPKMRVVSEFFTHPTCSYKADGVIDIQVDGCFGKPVWSWNGTPGKPMLTDIPEGLYRYEVRDEHACTLSGEVVLVAPKPLQISVIEQVEQSYRGTELGAVRPSDSNGLIRVSVAQGTPPYKYQWSTGGMDSVLSGLTFGVFSLTVSDDQACRQTSTFELPQRLPLTAILQQSASITCFEEQNAALQASVSGGIQPYLYRWKHNNSIDLQQNNLREGVYEFEVTDSRGIRSFDRLYIAQPDPLRIVLSADSVSGWEARDGSVRAVASGGTPPYTFDWGCSNAASVEQLPAGIYRLRLTDANFCTIEDSIEVYTPKKLIINSTAYHCSYFGAIQGKVQVEPNNGRIECAVEGGVKPYVYQWHYQPPNGNWVLLLSKTTPFVDSLASGQYIVTVTDSKGYKVSDTIRIKRTEPLEVTLSTVPLRCFGDTNGTLQAFVKGGTPPYSYRWNLNGTTDLQTSLRAGFYAVRVTDSLGVQSAFELQLTEPEPLTASHTVRAITGYNLNNGEIQAVVHGGIKPYTYFWTISDTTYQDSHIKDLKSGFYNFEVRDFNGCRWSSSIALNNPEALKIETSIRPESYFGSVQGRVSSAPGDGEIHLTVSGGFPPYRYEWSNGCTTSYITNLYSGSYTVKVVDKNGNEAYGSFILKVVKPLVMTVNQSRLIACSGDSSARLESHVYGGFPPYSYVWNTGHTTPVQDSLPAGEYHLYVTDSLNITANFTIRIDEPKPLSVAEKVSQPYCPNPDHGAISVFASGGVQPYRYSWNTSAQTAQLHDLQDGNYHVTVTDANGCRINRDFELRTPLTASIHQHEIIRCFGDSAAVLQLTVCGGQKPYVIRWNTGDSIMLLTNQKSGTYQATITDALGNSCISTHLVTEPQPLTINGSATHPKCFGEFSGSIDIVASGGLPPYLYRWSNLATTPHPTNLDAGTYHLFVTDRNGCQTTYSATLIEPEKPELELGKDRTLCQGQTHLITLPEGKGHYHWQKNNAFFHLGHAVELSETGIYTVVLEAENGCKVFDTVNITSINDHIAAEFWHSYEAIAGEDFVIANISQALEDSVLWTVTPTARILSQNPDYFLLNFADTGQYEIHLTTYKSSCFETATGLVQVISQDENNRLKRTSASTLSELKLFPNPAGNDVNVSVQAPQSATLHWTLTRAGTGITVQSGQIRSNSSGFATQRISLQNYARGVYIYRVFCGKEQISAQLIIL